MKKIKELLASSIEEDNLIGLEILRCKRKYYNWLLIPEWILSILTFPLLLHWIIFVVILWENLFNEAYKNDTMFILNIKEVDVLFNMSEINKTNEDDYAGLDRSTIMTPFSILYIIVKYRKEIWKKKI